MLKRPIILVLTTAVLLPGLAATPGATDLPDTDLLLHLPLDGGSIGDESGLKHKTELSGAVQEKGGFDDCFKFDGVDDHIRIADFDYGPEFTVSFWFNSSNNEGRSYQYMFSHGPIHEPHSGSYYFVEDDNPNFGGEIKTNLLDEDDPDRAEIFNTKKGLSDGAWHLYTVSAATEGASVYIDGELIKSADQGGDPINPEGDIIIGGRSDLHRNRFYDGYLDDVRVYSRALSAEEIKTLHQRGR